MSAVTHVENKLLKYPKIPRPTPDSFIYAYCNIRTNQVLYSLDRALKPRHLKQLPDVGANNTPPTLRKDSWRPLFTVSFPKDGHDRLQCLYIVRKLREYRKLHELNWKPSPLLSRPHTQEEIDEMQEKLDKRGGNKVETVYDLLKRKKWKMRVRTVMDQKANSIADLAAVLLQQDSVGEVAAQRNAKAQERHKEYTAAEMLSLGRKGQAGSLEPAERRVAELRAELGNLKGKALQKLHRRYFRARLRFRMMDFAVAAVAEATEAAQTAKAEGTSSDTNAEQRDGESATESAASAEPQASEQTDDTAVVAQAQSIQLADSDILPLLPPWPKHIDPWLVDKSRRKRRPKFMGDTAFSVRLNRPEFSTEGVTVSWANILDAEFAQEWPLAVQHRRMGFARHIAPLPLEHQRNPWHRAGRPEGQEHIGMADDVRTFREMQVTRRTRENAARRERASVLDSIKDKILASVVSGQGQEQPAGAEKEADVDVQAERESRPEASV